MAFAFKSFARPRSILSPRINIITKQNPATTWRKRSLVLKESVEVFIVSLDTKNIKQKEIRAARLGDTNHDSTIMPILYQGSSMNPVLIQPAPRSAPMTACVPETGIPIYEEDMMNENDTKQTLNIIFF